MGGMSCTWNGTAKNLKNFLKWFQGNYQELGLKEIRMRRGMGRFDPSGFNWVTLTGGDGEYEAEIGVREDDPEPQVVWTEPRKTEHGLL
jgi:hypothetical protein